jgi:hypothetical protein
LAIFDDTGKIVQKIMPSANGKCRFDFVIPNIQAASTIWKIAPVNNPSRAQIIPVNGGAVLTIQDGDLAAVSGDVLKFQLFLCKSDLTAAKLPLLVRMTRNGKSIDCRTTFTQGGNNVVYIPTHGMNAGEWNVEFICDGCRVSRKITLSPAVAR